MDAFWSSKKGERGSEADPRAFVDDPEDSPNKDGSRIIVGSSVPVEPK